MMTHNEEVLQRVRDLLEKLEHAPAQDKPAAKLFVDAFRDGLEGQKKIYLELVREEKGMGPCARPEEPITAN